MIKEPHFTPQRILNMLGLKPDSLGPYALVPGPKERSDLLLKLLASPQKSFTFLDYEMYTGALDLGDPLQRFFFTSVWIAVMAWGAAYLAAAFAPSKICIACCAPGPIRSRSILRRC